MKDFLLTLAGIGQMIGTWLGIYTPQTEQVTPAPQEQVKFGAINFVGTLPTTLSGSGITSSATSIGVVSMTLQQTGQALSMSDFGTIGYITLEPGVSSRQEFASFTGITQNSNGSAVLTGVTRGLAPVSPYTASSTFRFSHGGGTKLIVSNSPPFYDTFANKNNAGTITGQYTFASTAIPQMATNTTSAQLVANGTSTLATLEYVNTVAVSGAANATEAVKGISELGTAAEMASSTIFGSTGASTVIQTKNATDTPLAKCNSVGSASGSGCAVIAQLDGKISPNFIATSSAYSYNWGASTTFSGVTTLNGTTTSNASTTFNGQVTFASTTIGINDTYLTAQETIATGTPVVIGAGTDSTSDSYTISTGHATLYSFSPAATVWRSQGFTTSAQAVSVSHITFWCTTNASLETFTASIRADSGGLPTGSDIGAITGTATCNTAGSANATLTFSSPVSVSPNTVYHVVFRCTNNSGSNTCGIQGNNSAGTVTNSSANAGTSWSASNGAFDMTYNEISTVSGQVSKTKATVSGDRNQNFIGFTNTGGATSSILRVQTQGVVTGLSGLTAGAIYYLSNTVGAISTTAGTVTKKIGRALSATTLLIINDN